MLFVTLLSKTSTSLLYCNDCNKFLVDVEIFIFYCDLLIVLILHGLVWYPNSPGAVECILTIYL